MNEFILTFRNTHEAMEEEERLISSGYKLKMIPTPRGISSECGFSIKLSSEDPSITSGLTEKDNKIMRIYLLYWKNRRKCYEEIYRRTDSALPSAGH